ncbi:MAG: cofactor-independent phosphoglycerate mutase [Kiritimatiellae bacterium]|nr:cofactor-independent phosphoglycerate mutase [Kiritimatiellia bacterium]
MTEKTMRKVAVLVGDGMGDDPVPALGGRTPLQVADIPWMRRVAGAGHSLLIKTVPDGLAPGSDVANMGLLGYDARTNYTGRAAIEAAGQGLSLEPGDVAYRTNLVTIGADGTMEDYSAGDMPTEDGRALIASLGEAASAANPAIRFHGGVSYRHLLVWHDGPGQLVFNPPHEISGRPVADYLPTGPRAEEFLALMELSRQVFADHPVNRARRAKGLRPATQIWPWGAGAAMALQPYAGRYGRHGAIITAVDLVRGLANLAGLEPVAVPGATGWIDTNYAGKGEAAIKAFAEGADFVYVHVEAPDECGHKGLPEEKVKAIETIDRLIIGPVWQALEQAGEPYRLVMATDHRTPVARRGHTADPVPFAWVDGPLGLAKLAEAAQSRFDETIPPASSPLPLACELMDGFLRAP